TTAGLNTYIDGQLDNGGSLDNMAAEDSFNVAEAIIGADSAQTNNFNGDLDEFAVFNREMSATEVQDGYKRGAVSYKKFIRLCN
ncbi:MAG: hypothetical protein GTO02_02280, partial [Candidatus Dadabacteria bacterium]|nr:hypothetical protein [Candidatus Dadabacteria bacterium]